MPVGKRRPRRKGVKGKGWKETLAKVGSELNKVLKDTKVISKYVAPALAKKYNAGAVGDIGIGITESLGYGKRKARRPRKKVAKRGMRGGAWYDDLWTGFKWGSGIEPLRRLFSATKKETGIDVGGLAGTVAGGYLAGPGGSAVGGALGSAFGKGRKKGMKGGFSAAANAPNSSTSRGVLIGGAKRGMKGKSSSALNYPNASTSRGPIIKF